MASLIKILPIALYLYITLYFSLGLALINYFTQNDCGKKYFSFLLGAQFFALIAFYLLFGGYSIDAWRYLTRFTHNPFSFESEWIFWIFGNFLSSNFPNPWPLKLLMALSIIIWGFAIFRIFGSDRKEEKVWAFLIVPLMPAFFFAMGNAIRQGLSAALILHAIIYLFSRNRWQFWIISVTAILIHQVSIILVVAASLIRVPRKIVWAIFLIAPFVSYSLSFGLEQFDINLSDYVRYSERDEGQFHYAKFFVYYGIAGILLVMTSRQDSFSPVKLLSNVFVLMVSFSACLLNYEVPFERLALFADVFLPIIFGSLVVHMNLGVRIKYCLWVGTLFLGLLLSTSESVQHTLSVGLEHVQKNWINSYRITD
ncbi:EpsG family protein [Arenicellales bacterium IMCC58067]